MHLYPSDSFVLPFFPPTQLHPAMRAPRAGDGAPAATLDDGASAAVGHPSMSSDSADAPPAVPVLGASAAVSLMVSSDEELINTSAPATPPAMTFAAARLQRTSSSSASTSSAPRFGGGRINAENVVNNPNFAAQLKQVVEDTHSAPQSAAPAAATAQTAAASTVSATPFQKKRHSPLPTALATWVASAPASATTSTSTPASASHGGTAPPSSHSGRRSSRSRSRYNEDVGGLVTASSRGSGRGPGGTKRQVFRPAMASPDNMTDHDQAVGSSNSSSSSSVKRSKPNFRGINGAAGSGAAPLKDLRAAA